MTTNEVLQVLAVIKVAYPNSFNKLTKQDIDALTKLWERQFSEFDAKVVYSAIDTIIATDVSDFMPSIARIKQVCMNLLNPNQLSEFEAWEYVKKAMGNSIYEAQEEFNKLPTICQKIVGSPSRLHEWAMLPYKDIEYIVYNDFKKQFVVEREVERIETLMPLSAKERLMIGNDNKEGA